MIRMNRIIILCICLFLLSNLGTALPTPEEWKVSARDNFSAMTREEVNQYISPLITYNLSKGLIVVLVDKNGYTNFSFGDIRTVSGEDSNNQILFDIGSLSKVMTGILMAEAEINGVYNLSSPANTWISETVTLPDYEGEEITGLHLATHYSGLPSSPDPFSEYDPSASYADQLEQSMQHFTTMTRDEVYDWVKNTTLLAPPGYQHLYSNLGAALAGDSVAQAYGKSYPDLVQEHLFDPLQMTHTGASWTRDELGQRAKGYRAYEYPMDEAIVIRFNEFWTATGGIHSSAEDMAIFLAAQLFLVDTPLSEAIRKSHNPLALISEGPPLQEQAIFWDVLHNRDGTTIIKKAGETNAHQAAIAFNPDLQVGVVILSNTAHIQGIHVEEQAVALLERMQVKHIQDKET